MSRILQSKLTQCLLTLLAVSVLAGCQTAPTGADLREVTVLYTNDEHGWMEGMEPGQGAASLYQLWEDQEGLTDDDAFLLLSGGDNWTGPAISTWTEGESMVEVMNAMRYDASAVGNHEFDFGLEAFAERTAEAAFPYLSANTRWRETGEVPVDLGILPYSIQETNGLTVGIIGLTTTSTPYTTNPLYVSRLAFQNYESALRMTVPLVEAAEPDLLFVISHVCLAEIEPLARQVSDLGIDLMGTGHCNELVAKQVGETVVIGGGYHFTSYAKAQFVVDRATGDIVSMNFSVNEHAAEPDAPEDPAIAALVGGWQAGFEEKLSEVVAWSEQPLNHRSPEFGQAVIDSWLAWDPDADVAITNAGGLRTPLPEGEITFGDIVSVMPFENSIIAVTIPGSALARALDEGGRPIVAGLVRRGDRWVSTDTGEPLSADREYRVLVNSFMYAGGDNFDAIGSADPNGFDTGISYRQPFVDALNALDSGPDQPVDLSDLITTINP